MKKILFSLLCVVPACGWTAESISLAKAAELFAARSAELPPGSVQAVAIDHQLPLGNCPSGWQWSFPYEARTTVQVSCTASPTPSRRLVAVRYLLDDPHLADTRSTPPSAKRYVVAARDLQVGSILSADDLEVIDALPKDRVFASTLSDPDALVGLSLTRPVRRGESLGRADARNVQLIKRNAPVSAWSAFPGGRVSAKLVALQNGKAGEWILLENPQSGRKIRGLVQTDSTVRISGGAAPTDDAQVLASVVD